MIILGFHRVDRTSVWNKRRRLAWNDDGIVHLGSCAADCLCPVASSEGGHQTVDEMVPVLTQSDQPIQTLRHDVEYGSSPSFLDEPDEWLNAVVCLDAQDVLGACLSE